MEWWRNDRGKKLERDYFRVESETGARFWLYREGLYNRELEPPVRAGLVCGNGVSISRRACLKPRSSLMPNWLSLPTFHFCAARPLPRSLSCTQGSRPYRNRHCRPQQVAGVVRSQHRGEEREKSQIGLRRSPLVRDWFSPMERPTFLPILATGPVGDGSLVCFRSARTEPKKATAFSDCRICWIILKASILLSCRRRESMPTAWQLLRRLKETRAAIGLACSQHALSRRRHAASGEACAILPTGRSFRLSPSTTFSIMRPSAVNCRT